MSGEALFSPAAARNCGPILDVLRRVLPRSGLVLEIASGTGEHAAHFARAMAGLTWQPSDPDETARCSIQAHRDVAGLPNLLAPLPLDVSAPVWLVERAEAVVAINLVHIAPWAATLGLMAGAARVLEAGGSLVLYGPYKEGGAHTAPSNAAFDASLMASNPAWGVRDLENVAAAARARDLALSERVAMPANNLTLVFRRMAASE